MKYQQPYGVNDDNAGYIDGNPALGIEGSAVPAKALEHPQRELDTLIRKAGLTPSETDLEQVYKAIKVLAPTPGTLSVTAPLTGGGNMGGDITLGFDLGKQYFCEMTHEGNQYAYAATYTLMSLKGPVGGEQDWADTVNSAFFPKMPGYYYFNIGFIGNGPNSASLNFDLYLYKNGDNNVGRQSGVMMGSSYAFNASGITYLDGINDKITAKIVTNSGSSALNMYWRKLFAFLL